jgi:hypothetical protein
MGSAVASITGGTVFVRGNKELAGMKTGDQISPPGGYVGGGLQMQTDLAIDPAGNAWVMNNWQDIDSCHCRPTLEEAHVRCRRKLTWRACSSLTEYGPPPLEPRRGRKVAREGNQRGAALSGAR